MRTQGKSSVPLNLICLGTLLFTACTRVEDIPAELQRPVWADEARGRQMQCPLTTAVDAAWAALRIDRGASVFLATGPQRVRAVQRTTYSQGYDAIHGERGTAERVEPPETSIWLVELDGMWQVQPPGTSASYTPRRYRMRVAVKATGDCAPTLSMRATELVAGEGE